MQLAAPWIERGGPGEKRDGKGHRERKKKRDIQKPLARYYPWSKKNWCIVRCFVTNVPHKALRFLLLFIFGFGDI
jgi:hypothetical protein